MSKCATTETEVDGGSLKYFRINLEADVKKITIELADHKGVQISLKNNLFDFVENLPILFDYFNLAVIEPLYHFIAFFRDFLQVYHLCIYRRAKGTQVHYQIHQ